MIGVGLVGCGGMGAALLQSAAKLSNVDVVGAYDVNPDGAKKVTSENGGRACNSYAELLNMPALDAVIVATPGYLHAPFVKGAAAASKHVFCEKPFALNLRDCDDMIQARNEAGVNLMVGQVLRLLPVFKETARIVRQELGKPVAMGIMRVGGWGYASGWRTKVEMCGGMLLEVNVHELDYMRYLLGDPVEAFAYGGRFVLENVDFMDTVMASFKFRGGAVGTLKATVSSELGQYTGEVFCQGGTLFYDNGSSTIRYRRKGSEEVIVTKEELPSGGVDEEMQEFVASIEESRKPSITGEDGRAAVEMALAVRRSAQEGIPVAIGQR